MLKLAELIVRFRWVVIGSIIVLSALLGWQAKKVGLNADFSTYLRQDDPMVKQFNRIGEIFGGNSTGIVLITSGDLFTGEKITLLKKLTEAYAQVEGIGSAISLTNTIDFRKTEWGLDIGKLFNVENIPEKKAVDESLQQYIRNNERFRGKLISEDGTIAAIILRFQNNSSGKISQFATSLRINKTTENLRAEEIFPAGTKIYFGGMPFMVFNMTTLITQNLTVLLPIMIFILIFILYLGFRHWAGVLFPLLVVMISDLWLVGLMGIFKLKFDLLTGIAPVILLALGSADGVHLMKRYFERRRQGDSSGYSAKIVFKEMGTPIVLTTVTTMVGFLSLLISDFSVIQQFGLITAIGVLFALVITLTLLPALLSFGITPKQLTHGKQTTTKFLDSFSRLVYTHKLFVLSGGAAIVLVALLAIPRIFKDVDWTLCLQKDSPPYHAEMLLRERFGGSLPVQLLVRGDLKEPVILQMMQKVERRLKNVPQVSQPQSIATVISEMNDVMNDRFAIPFNRTEISQLWFLIENEELMQRLVADGEKQGLVQAKLATWHTSSLTAAIDSIKLFLKNLPREMTVVDISKLPNSERNQLLKLRNQQIAEEIHFLLLGHGIELPESDLEEIVVKAENFVITNSILGQIAEKVKEYLKSPEAEIELTSTEILRIKNAVLKQITGFLPVQSQIIARIVTQTNNRFQSEDAADLAESLTALINQTIGKEKTAPILAEIQSLVQLPSVERRDISRKAKGILWQLNENMIFLNTQKAKKILTDYPEKIEREVSWQVEQTGMAPLLNRMEEELTPTQTYSILLTMIFIILIITAIFRSPSGGLIAVVPIAVTILVNFAVMGYLQIGLDSFTAMIASIAIGLGIDTDIHFISRLRDELRKDGDQLKAFQRTVRTTGLSILINAIAVGAGFLVLLLAGGQHIRRFGGLTAMTIFVSALFTLTILPALLFWINPKFLSRKTDAVSG